MRVLNSPFLLGFEHLERLLERTAKATQESYPPYNIEHQGDDRLRIALAVAGFSASDLSVTVEGNQLVIRGRQGDGADKTYLHRGIAARQFQRVFVLADGIRVLGAELRHGLLSIDLDRPKQEETVKTIPIVSTDNERNAVANAPTTERNTGGKSAPAGG